MRLLRPTLQSSPPARDAAAPPDPVAAPVPPPADGHPEESPPVDAGLAAERRLRRAGGPEDQATYDCRCGAVFPASPTTSVSCPLCGVHQAW